MESIRININKQLSQEGLVPVVTHPAESAYDFRLRSCKEDMANISTETAYRITIYPDGQNLQVSLIKSLDNGFIEYAVLTDTRKKTIDGKQTLKALSELAKAYETLAANDKKPIDNQRFRQAVADIHQRLCDNAQPGSPNALPVAKSVGEQPLTHYINYKTTGEIATLLRFPDQAFFEKTPVVYLVGENVHPTRPQNCKHIHTVVLRTFPIVSPDGYEYGKVKEGSSVRVHLKGKEGMLPMTADIRGDVQRPTPFGYFDTTTSTICLDERTVKFYYELKFIVKHNGRQYRSCLVRYNGEQVMPDNNGCYLIKIYEDRVNDAGTIRFSGENFKDAEIKVTPGIVKQQEYVFTPEPQHDITHVTLDFGDGNPIETMIDIGTNERLYHQLRRGKVKGYRVKAVGESYRMMIPRKLTPTSKNILRLFKFLAMILFTLLAYALLTRLATSHWPWPIERNIATSQRQTDKQVVDDSGEVTTVEKESGADVGLIVDDRDQVTLEGLDFAYLNNNEVWRKDSIKSNRYHDVINTIFNGRISEMKMKNYNTKVIGNSWWAQIWRDIIVPNNIHGDEAQKVFEKVITPDHNSLNVKTLWEELNKKASNSTDVVTPSASQPRVQSTTPVVPTQTYQAPRQSYRSQRQSYPYNRSYNKRNYQRRQWQGQGQGQGQGQQQSSTGSTSSNSESSAAEN